MRAVRGGAFRMSGIGTGYDLSGTTYSPDGRVFQAEYACKAVDNAGTTIGVKCSDGVRSSAPICICREICFCME